MQSDVDGGRKILNFSEWDKPQPALAELVDVISRGQMPPLKYRVLPNHAKARLSDAEKARLIAGLRRLYATDPPAAIKAIGTQRAVDGPGRRRRAADAPAVASFRHVTTASPTSPSSPAGRSARCTTSATAC